MNLRSLEVGQKFQYAGYFAKYHFLIDSFEIEYRGDTLELEVQSVENGRYLISERITLGSDMLINNKYDLADSIFSNYWSIRNDTLIIEAPGNKLRWQHLYLDDRLPLSPFAGQELQSLEWKTMFFSPSITAELFIENYLLSNFTYDQLNILINNVPLQTDGTGKVTVYSAEHGIIRFSAYSAFPHTGSYNWDRIRYDN